MNQINLSTLLGDHAVTAALKSGKVTSSRIHFDFADVAVPNTAFKRLVRDLEFDVAELAIVTFLMAKDRGIPLTLLPVVVTARFQHQFLLHNTDRGTLKPEDLNGKRIGIRSWTVTTVAWIKQILCEDHGVDLNSIEWVTFEDAHVEGFTDPPEAKRAHADRSLETMLKTGDIDAAVISTRVDDPAIQPVFHDPAAAASAWHRTHQAIQINHMMVVKSELLERSPDRVRELYSLLKQSHAARPAVDPNAPDMSPIGIEATRNHLQTAIDAVLKQKLITTPLSVDDLFDDVTRDFT